MLRRGAVGVGFRPELAVELIGAPRTVDFVEVVAEACFAQRAMHREACALAELWPVIPHGVKLSLGSADGVDLDRARRLGQLARDLRAPVISEHVSFTRAGGTEIGHLTQLPRTRDAVAVVAKNVARVRRVLPDVPLLLENVAWMVRWPDDEMTEAAFYGEIVRATGCDLLLDVGNLYANARNEGLDPATVLAAYPLEHVAMVHVAGGVIEDGFYFDTHAHPIPHDVYELVARVPDVPAMIERDADIVFADVAAELARLRALRRPPALPHTTGTPSPGADAPALAVAQAALAAELTGATPCTAEVARARGILQRKRVDEALPLLANLARLPASRDVAARALVGVPRRPQRTGIADARCIAEAALAEPALANAAAIDLLALRARFTPALEPRRAPFFGHARLDDGRRVRAFKGIGALAPVRMQSRR